MAVGGIRRSWTNPLESDAGRMSLLYKLATQDHAIVRHRGQDRPAVAAQHCTGIAVTKHITDLELEIWSMAHYFAWEHLHAFGKRLSILEASLEVATSTRQLSSHDIDPLLTEIRAEIVKTQQLCEREGHLLSSTVSHVEDFSRDFEARIGRIIDRLSVIEQDLDWFRGEHNAIRGVAGRLDRNMDAIRGTLRTGMNKDELEDMVHQNQQVRKLDDVTYPPDSLTSGSDSAEKATEPPSHSEEKKSGTSAHLPPSVTEASITRGNRATQSAIAGRDTGWQALAAGVGLYTATSESEEVGQAVGMGQAVGTAAKNQAHQRGKKSRFKNFRRYTGTVAKRFKKGEVPPCRPGAEDAAMIWEFF